MRWAALAALAVLAVGGLALAEDGSVEWPVSFVGSSQDCIWVEPGGSIQAIINAAPSGSIVCLPDGIWMENLVIHKSLTLRGQGPERSRIQAKNIVEPIVWIRGSKTTPITVVIEGVMLLGQTVIALDGVEFVEYANVGIFVDGTAHITLQNCAFLGREIIFGSQIVPKPWS